tara:strand:+ start:1253 stop:1576 length:324 start_codon:yes stop_codon:yes gene_type:complete
MDNHPAIRPNSKQFSKSAMASKAIQWFFESPVLTKERDQETGDFTGKYVVGSHGQPTPIELLMKIEELENKLNEITSSSQITNDEAKHTSPGGGIWFILHKIRSFLL